MKRLPILALLAVMTLVLTACGTAKIDVTTTVLSPEEAEQRLTMRADGMIAQAMGERLTPEDVEKDGWKATIQKSGDVATLDMVRKSGLRDAWDMPESLSGDGKKPEVDVGVTDGLLSRDYHVVLKIPATSMPNDLGDGQVLNAQQQQQLQQMLQQAFKITWTVTLPGDITDTNADRRNGNSSGSWDLTLDRLQSGMEVRIASREVKAVMPLAAGAGGILLVLLLTGYAFMSSRRHGAGEPALATAEPASVTLATTAADPAATAGLPDAEAELPATAADADDAPPPPSPAGPPPSGG